MGHAALERVGQDAHLALEGDFELLAGVHDLRDPAVAILRKYPAVRIVEASTNAPNGIIAANWDDLENTTAADSGVYTSVTGTSPSRTFIVEWRDSLTTGAWSSVGVTEQILTYNGTVQSVKATLPAGAGPRFGRLRVVR